LVAENVIDLGLESAKLFHRLLDFTGAEFHFESTTMVDESTVRLRTHRNNIHRYRRLLDTQLSDLERNFILRRLGEEQMAFDQLSRATFPFVLPLRPRAAHARLPEAPAVV
jgi:hypothetical protein